MKRFSDLITEYNCIKKELIKLQQKKMEIMNIYCYPKSANWGERIQKCIVEYPAEKYTDKIIQIDNESLELFKLYNYLSSEIDKKLNCIVNEKFVNILKDKIFTDMSLRELGEKYRYSKSQISNIWWNCVEKITEREI